MKVNVTQRDIDRARRDTVNLASHCPVARALHRHRPFRDALVTENGRILGYNYNVLPSPRFVKLFDKGALVDPFSFEIEVPS